MYVLLYLEFYAPTFTSAEILRAAELSPSRSDLMTREHQGHMTKSNKLFIGGDRGADLMFSNSGGIGISYTR